MEIQEHGSLYELSFSRMYVFEIWLSGKGSDTERCSHVIQELINSVNDAEYIDTSNLECLIKNICKCIARYWKIVYKGKQKFYNKYSNWLAVVENVTLPKNDIQCTQTQESENPTHSRGGRPRKDFSDCSQRTKRRRLADLSKADNSTVSALLNSSESLKESSVRKINPDEVLSLIVEAKLTKHQYILIKKFVDTKIVCDILPSYHNVLSAKKKCYPLNETTTESSAEIDLQSMLDHTVSRILESQKHVLENMPKASLNDLTLIGKWGFDGSTGHSEYKQSFSNSSLKDDSLFVTPYVPLQLVRKINSGDESIILWKNPRPSSTRYCRPLRFQFLKETSAVSLQEEAYYKQKITNLVPTVSKLNDTELHIKHSLQLTMVDGRVCSSLSETSSSRCYLCNATPTEMNKIDICLAKEIISEDRFEFGLSPLHSWIRFFEYFIHLSYRLDIKKWQIRSSEEKGLLKHKKEYVQSEFRSKLGLYVDRPRSGGSGTSNDGNTARKFFRHSDVSAGITGLRKDLIERCCTILQSLSSGYEIDKNKFKEYALETARLLVQEYPWYNMPASIHKVLNHGASIIENALLPIGELSEEAAESNNKNIKAFRRDYTRKMTREVTNLDLMHRLLLNSDPLITGLRKLPCKKTSISSKSVLYLLCGT